MWKISIICLCCLMTLNLARKSSSILLLQRIVYQGCCGASVSTTCFLPSCQSFERGNIIDEASKVDKTIRKVVARGLNTKSIVNKFNQNNPSVMMSFHVKCRYPNEYKYGNSQSVKRAEVPAGLISWDIDFDHYDPISFTSPHVLTAPWADPKLEDENFDPKFNEVDGKVNRKSYEGKYLVTKNKEPLNIRGRTGLKGRGNLGRWGPNHAADPIVTRWKRDGKDDIVTDEKSGKKVLQFVSIQRKDNGEWAIPGGMVDPGEQVSTTVKREFMEEAMNINEISSEEEKVNMEAMVKDFFDACGREVYSGYVDDPRNTDNAWMETTAFWFHDDTGEKIGKFKLQAGDDAGKICWMDLSSNCSLYASHLDFLRKVVDLSDAHF